MVPSVRIYSSLLIALLLTGSAAAQVKFPKPPDSYQTEFRYRIKAGKTERIAQFVEMEKFVNKLGFVEKEDPQADLAMFNPAAERMIGTIPSDKARQLLDEPRIQTILVAPATWKIPADEKERVKVLLDLTSGFPLARQQLFSNQIKNVLTGLGFVEAVGYDHRGYTRLRGTIPWIRVPTLLKDLRGQPAGWFLPLSNEDDVPDPLRSHLAIRWIEVLPEEGAPAPVMGQAPLPETPADQAFLVKLTPELRRALKDEGRGGLPLRVEVVMNYTPSEIENAWREGIRFANPTSIIEGRLGNIVTVAVPVGEQITGIARLPFVLSIRLPRVGSFAVPAPAKEEPKKDEPKEKVSHENKDLALAAANVEILKATRLDRYHAQGSRGTGIRVAVIDTDFTGWRKHVGKELPRDTHYVDLTAERNSAIEPEPSLVAPGNVGQGTLCALAVRVAAPNAEIVLVRIAPDAPYELIGVYRYMLGDFTQPESFRIRREEIEIDGGNLRAERLRALDEYRKAFDNFDDDDMSRDRRRAAKAAVLDIEAREKLLSARADRLLLLETDLQKLRGAKVILNTIGWSSGQPFDANSLISRFLDDKMSVARPNVVLNGSKLRQPTLWFQPGGDTRGQAWVGSFRDADANGIMEFLQPDEKPRAGRWSTELNFLAFRNPEQRDEPDLPKDARIRVTVQWREPHDPGISEVEYREPIAPLNLRLLHQRDPDAANLATDELEEMARSEGLPDRLHYEANYGIYEQAIDLTLPAGGRYALRVEGKHPLGVRPGGAYGFRDQEIRWDLRLRVFVEVLDLPTRAKGRIVFSDYESILDGVAVPADARTVVGVGALTASRKRPSDSAVGSGLVADLFLKPNVFTFERLTLSGEETRGSAIAAAVAAGTGACLLEGGAHAANFLEMLHIPYAGVFEIPNGSLKK